MLCCVLRFAPTGLNHAVGTFTRNPPHASIATSKPRVLGKIQRTTPGSNRWNAARPSIDDVERISRGQGAKRRGVGSRSVPHRLNAEERIQFDLAKKKGFLSIKGTAYRRERRGSPLANIFRQWCDARGIATCLVSQQLGDNDQATVIVDLSTLRNTIHMASAACTLRTTAAAEGAAWLADPAAHVPFTCITDVSPPEIEGLGGGEELQGEGSSDHGAVDETQQQHETETALIEAALIETALTETALTEESPGGDGVLTDIDTMSDEDVGAGLSEAGPQHEAWTTLAIWQLPPVVVAFSCSRATSKGLVQVLAKAVAQQT